MRAAAFALVAALLAAGCGRTSETGSARERDEPRPYGHVVVRSELTPRRVTLGDPVVWTLTATLPAGVTPAGIALGEAPSGLEIVPRGPADASPIRGGVAYRRVYDLRGFDLGDLPLPAAAITLRARGKEGAELRDSLAFPADTLAVDSLTTAATGDIAPDRGPVDPGLRPIDIAVAVGAGLLLVGAIVALVLAWRRRRARPAAAAPAEPPEIAYRRAIASLRDEGPSLARDAFHDRLSEAVRRYVSDASGIDALDMTTRELERAFARASRARPEAAAEVVRILRRSDLVKFARRPDAWEEAMRLLDDAARLEGTVVTAVSPEGQGPGPESGSEPAAPPTEGRP